MIVQTPLSAVPLSMQAYIPLPKGYGDHTLVDVQTENTQTIEWMWRFFKALPPKSHRFVKTRAAVLRMEKRLSTSRLPPREAFTTTVDYYESALPLYVAKKRFETMLLQNPIQRTHCLRQALHDIVPATLF